MAITGDDTRGRKARRALDRHSLFPLWSDEHTTPDGPPSGSRRAFLKLKVVFPRRWRFRRSAMRGDLQSYFSLRSRGKKKQTNCPLQTGDFPTFSSPSFSSFYLFFFFLWGRHGYGSQTFLLQNAVWKRCKTKLLKCKGGKQGGKTKGPLPFAY